MSQRDRTGTWQSPGTVPLIPHPVASDQPKSIGRYRVERVLGEGGFGLVYLAHDDQLQRPVAIKVPHRRLISRPEDAEGYLAEARIVAKLDHSHIVPVHDVGSTQDFPCFVVSKFIEGSTLASKIREERPSFGEAAELVPRWPKHCNTPTARDLCIETSSPAISCWTPKASRMLRISGWRSRKRTLAKARTTPGRLPT